MYVTSCYAACFVLFEVFVLHRLFCHGALKLDPVYIGYNIRSL